jgi:hypothetical protein
LSSGLPFPSVSLALEQLIAIADRVDSRLVFLQLGQLRTLRWVDLGGGVASL